MFGWFDRKHLGWLSRFMKNIPLFPIPGNGKFVRQPLFVSDFCEIIYSCIDSMPKKNLYNISGIEEIFYIDMIKLIRKLTNARSIIFCIPFRLFHFLLYIWGIFDKNPPFTTQQLDSLVQNEKFELIDWMDEFNVKPTPLIKAFEKTFLDEKFSKIKLYF